MKKVNTRLLIKVPILHTKEDMGSLGHRLMVSYGYHTPTYDYWEKIQAEIKSLPYDFGKIKVYQDGLPDTKQELVERIVAEVQSPNYELLRWLRNQGATVIGTENPKKPPLRQKMKIRNLRQEGNIKKKPIIFFPCEMLILPKRLGRP